MTMRTPEEIAAKMNALSLWEVLGRGNFAIRPRGTAFPYFVTVLKGDDKPVKTRLLLLEGWQTLHDFVRTRMDANFGFYSTPAEMPHFELDVCADGKFLVFRHDACFVPHVADETDRAFVARLLWEVYGIMLRLEGDSRLPFRYADDRALFSRVEKADGTWEDAPLVISDPPPYKESVSFSKEDIKKAKDLPFVREDVVEIDFRLRTDVLTREKRPRSVYGLKVVDPKTGETVADCTVSPNPEAGLKALWETVPPQVLKILIRRGKVPGEVRLKSGRLFRLLKSLCIELPFKISLHDKLSQYMV